MKAAKIVSSMSNLKIHLYSWYKVASNDHLQVFRKVAKILLYDNCGFKDHVIMRSIIIEN